MKTLHFGSTYCKRSLVVAPTFSEDATYGYAIWSNDLGKWSFTKDITSVYDLNRCFTVDKVYALNEYNYLFFSKYPEDIIIADGSIW